MVIAVGCGGRQATPPPPLAGSGSATTTVATPPPDAAVREPDPPLPPPGPLDHDLDRLAERSVALYGDIVRAFDNAAEDCPAATRRLDELTRSYADVIAANAKVLHEGRELQLKIALRRFDDQFQKAAKAIMQSKTIAACFQDAAFGKALEGLVGARP